MISYEPLKKYLKSNGMTISELSLKMGVEDRSLRSRMSYGTLNVSTVAAICKALDCNIGDVICYEKDGVRDHLVSVNWDKISAMCKDISLTKLAAALGKNPSTFTAGKRLNNKIMYSTAREICDYFKCNVEDIINE